MSETQTLFLIVVIIGLYFGIPSFFRFIRDKEIIHWGMALITAVFAYFNFAETFFFMGFLTWLCWPIEHVPE